jgi:hypothetical protein
VFVRWERRRGPGLFPLAPLLERKASGAPEDGSDEEPEESAHESRNDLLDSMHDARLGTGTEGNAHPEADDGPQEGSDKVWRPR